MKPFSPRPWRSVLLLIALAPLFLDGCVAIGVPRAMAEGAPSATGSLDVGVFEKPSDTKPLAGQVVTRLVRLESGMEKPVYESSSSAWSQDDLAPGRYRLRIVRWIDQTGTAKKLSNTELGSFQIHAGERVQARVILKKFPTGTVVVIGAIVVVAAVAAAVASASHGLGGGFSLGGKSRSHTKTRRDQRNEDYPVSRLRSFR